MVIMIYERDSFELELIRTVLFSFWQILLRVKVCVDLLTHDQVWLNPLAPLGWRETFWTNVRFARLRGAYLLGMYWLFCDMELPKMLL